MQFKEKTMEDSRAVVVCTKYRGVFFGYLSGPEGAVVTLTNVRMCVYWDTSVRGVLGLASHGPSEKCRITRPVDSISLRGVTAIMDTTDIAVKAWESSPWK